MSKETADTIEKDLLGDYFDWYWNKSTLGLDEVDNFKTKNTVDGGQFCHRLLDTNTNTRSTLYEGFIKVFDIINYENTIRVKCNLNLNKTGYKKTSHQPIHIDVSSKENKSLIYYVNDSDGDTIFFNKKLKEIKRVTPKKNTAVLFDSNILHCGCNPIKSSMRGVINFIFKDNENNFLYR